MYSWQILKKMLVLLEQIKRTMFYFIQRMVVRIPMVFTISYTLKINKEHNDGGLEDDYPFQRGAFMGSIFKISPCFFKTCCIGTKQTGRWTMVSQGRSLPTFNSSRACLVSGNGLMWVDASPSLRPMCGRSPKTSVDKTWSLTCTPCCCRALHLGDWAFRLCPKNGQVISRRLVKKEILLMVQKSQTTTVWMYKTL